MNNCVIWTKRVDENGYGRCPPGNSVATRVLWENSYGPIPPGLIIRHRCDNPTCINLDHLELGTQLDNIQDRVDRGRCATGIKNGRTKVTPNMIDYILSSTLSSRVLGRALGVSHTTIIWVRNGKTTLSFATLESQKSQHRS